MWMPETEKLLKEFSQYKEIDNFAFCGGSALSYYIKHRLSEDIDFFLFHLHLLNKSDTFFFFLLFSYIIPYKKQSKKINLKPFFRRLF